MPLSPRVLSATPSAAPEQLVPSTATMSGLEASFVDPAWPPSGEHRSSSFWSCTGWFRIWPAWPSNTPSRWSIASSIPYRLSLPRSALSPLTDRSVPIWIGAPAATVTHPGAALQSTAPPEVDPPADELLFEHAAAIIANAPRSTSGVSHRRCLMKPPFVLHPWIWPVGITSAGRRPITTEDRFLPHPIRTGSYSEMAGSSDLSPERLRELQRSGGIAGHEGRHEGRTHDDPVRERACLPGLLGRRDPDADQQWQVRVRTDGRHHLPGRHRELVPATRHAVGSHAIDESVRTGRDRLVPLRGRAGRREQDDVDPARGTDRCEAPRLVDREVGNDRAGDPRRGQVVAERLVPTMVHDVGIGHDRDRDVDRGGGDRREDIVEPGAAFERDPRRLLDHAAVHDGIRVRDADLDRVGPGRAELPQEPHIHARVAARNVGDEGLRASVTDSPEGRLQPVHQRPTRVAIMFRRRRARRARYRGPCRRVRKGSPVPAPPPGAVDGGAIRSRAPARVRGGCPPFARAAGNRRGRR